MTVYDCYNACVSQQLQCESAYGDPLLRGMVQSVSCPDFVASEEISMESLTHCVSFTPRTRSEDRRQLTSHAGTAWLWLWLWLWPTMLPNELKA